MANWQIDPKVLEPHVPAKTGLDLFEGNCYVSLIGFMFEETSLLGVRVPFHINFEEVNLRFYVRFKEAGQWRRGAVFLREIVPKAAISFIANTLYNEKYITLKMQHYYRETEQQIELGYQWRYRNKWNRLEAVTALQGAPMLPGSEEEFIAEHYWGYSRYNALTSFEYGVEHTPWLVHPVSSYNIECDFEGLYGKDFAFMSKQTPNSVFMAKGSPISILHKRKL